MKSILLLSILGLSLVIGAPDLSQTQLANIRPRIGPSCRNSTNKCCCREVLEEVMPVVKNFQDAILANDPEEIIKFYTSNAVLSVGLPGSPFFVGAEEILRGFLIPSSETYYSRPDLSQCLYSVECPDTVTLYGLVPYTFIPRNDDPFFTIPTQAIITFKRNAHHKDHPYQPTWLIVVEYDVDLPVF